MATAEEWLNKLSRLRVDRAKGNPAPHKPLLLLILLEMAEQGTLPPKVLLLTPELAYRFCTFWSIVAHRRNRPPDVRFPFHCLRSDGCWTALTEDGKPSPHYRLTSFASMMPDFVACFKDPAWREKARRRLIASYFTTEERIALYTLVGLPVPSEEEVRRDASAEAAAKARKQGRAARFRLDIVAAYNYTCALTRYRLTTVAAGSIVDAAHIHQFAHSRNNDPQNGLALCKNAHWLFDNGLWTLTDEHRVLVALGRFAEESPDQKGLSAYHGQRIHLPADKACWPDPEHIAWHRKHRFQGQRP